MQFLISFIILELIKDGLNDMGKILMSTPLQNPEPVQFQLIFTISYVISFRVTCIFNTLQMDNFLRLLLHLLILHCVSQAQKKERPASLKEFSSILN
jgi:hypothetical protein